MASTPRCLSRFGGNTYRLGGYPLPMMWIYNKDPTGPGSMPTIPKASDVLPAACEKLKSKDISPLSGGNRDDYSGEWWSAHGFAQNANDQSLHRLALVIR